MSYSRFQQFVSYLLIVSILFLQTFEIPFLNRAQAEDTSNSRIISFIVDEATYDELSSEIKTYAKDIQGYMDNVRVAIFPVPRDINPYEIASINERLYYQGDGKGLSQLAGTILFGPVPLPVVHKNDKTFLSLYPYTDFDEKAFVYNQTKNYYEYTDKSLTNERPEVWHSVIAPNSGDETKDILDLQAFLEKTHDFYTSKGVFSESLKDPYVFYYDGLKEQQSTRLVPYKMYQEWIKNIEDITYKRTWRDLLTTINKVFESYSNEETANGVDTTNLDPKLQELLWQAAKWSGDFTGMPDIMARQPIDKILKIFHETINEVYFGDLMKFVFNTGRYGNGQNVRVDTIPFLIDKKDREMQQSLLVGNNLIEKTIDDLVKTKLSKNIILYTHHILCDSHAHAFSVDYDYHRSDNFIEGKRAIDITRPEECSVFRGGTSTGSVLVEADRAFSTNNFMTDSGSYKAGSLWSDFGNHSPYNITFSGTLSTYKSGIIPNKYAARNPLFDITGSIERKKGTPTPDRIAKESSYIDCLVPVNLMPTERAGWRCSTRDYTKEIPSWMMHKSPTNEEYETILETKTTPSMPMNHDRYVDFQSQSGSYQRIDYPNLFWITISDGDLTYSGVTAEIKKLLDAKSKEINTKARSEVIDLFQALSTDPKMFDSVVRHVIWHNLQSPTAKYKYVLENYLDIDGGSPLKDVAHKSDYEIAYIGAPGTTQNMYVRLDPEEKGWAPEVVKKILAKSLTTKQALDGAKIASPGSNDKPAEFKCGKPEWVPIFQWPSAIQCWLQNLMPVGISSGSCGASTLWMSGESSLDSATSAEDQNRNGVPDAAEKIAQGYISLKTEKKIIQYGESIWLDAILLDSDGKTRIVGDSFSEVEFEITKIVSREGVTPKTVYDANNSFLSNTGIIQNYVTFNPLKIRAQEGKASYALGSKYQDSDVTLRASILTRDSKGQIIVDTISNPLVLNIRGDRLSVVSKIKDDNGEYVTSSNIEAGNTLGITFEFDKTDKNNRPIVFAPPYELRISNDITGEEVGKPISILKASEQSFVFKNPNILNVAGVYRFAFRDDEGFETDQTITVLPGPVTRVKVTPSSTKFVKWTPASVFVELYDRFGNLAKGDVYDVTAKLNGVGVFSDVKTSETHKVFSEGFGTFQIESKESGTSQIKISIPGAESELISLEAIDFAKVVTSIEWRDEIFVGGNPHTIGIKIVDAENKPITGFHTDAAVSIPELAGTLSTNLITIKDGVGIAPLTFTPYTIAQNAKLSVQVLGVEEIMGNTFAIHPEKPARIGFSDVSEKIEAREGNYIQAQASLYDRYGNIASYKTDDYTATLTILSEYTPMIHFNLVSPGHLTELGMAKEYKFVEGTAIANVYTSEIPGGSWLIAELHGDVQDTIIETKDSSGKIMSLTIPAVREDATKIDTYYFWNQEKLDATKYNTLYTTLFGSSYGDVTQSNYLGGSVIFNPQGRSLAVTSLLNNPYQKNLAFGFTPAGKYLAPAAADKTTFNITPQVGSRDHRFVIDLYDTLYKETVARTWITPRANSQLFACEGGENKNISTCSVSPENPYILLQGSTYATVEKNTDALSLIAGGIKVLEIATDGVRYQYPGVTLDLDRDAIGNYLGMRVVFNGEQIGYVAMKLDGTSINAYPSRVFPGILSKNEPIILETLSNRYNAVGQYLGNSSAGSRGIAVYQWSDEADEYAPDETLLGGGELIWLEQSLKENGVGWKDTNKMMLEFAASNGMGEATRFYQTYSMINLWDPIVHLPAKKNVFTKQDRTVGTKIAEGRGEEIESYKKLDFNGDNQEDLVIFYKSGKVELLANYAGVFKNLGYWVYAPDADEWSKNVGFFAWKDANDRRYSSLVMLEKKSGQLILFENRWGKLIRRDMSAEVKSNSGASRIRQMSVFDMDRDGADDLVVLFENGELDIFYGGTRVDGSGNRVITFARKLVDASLKIQLSSEIRHDGGALYFDGLPQLPDTNGQSQSQADFLKQSENLAKSTESGLPGSVEDALFDRFLYYQYAYDTGDTIASTTSLVSGISQAIGTDPITGQPATGANDIANGWQEIQDLQNQDVTFTSEGIDTTLVQKAKPLTFIRSEYAEAKGVTIDKTYAAGSGNVVQTGAPITIRVDIKNTSWKFLKNIIYLEQPDAIVHVGDSLTYTLTARGTTVQRTAKELMDGDFTHGIDGLFLAPNETVTLTYSGVANPVELGKIDVGVLEQDDVYGDMALNPNKVCGATYILWKSTAARAYSKTDKTFQSEATPPVDPSKIQSISDEIKKYTDQIQVLNKELESANALRRAIIMKEIQEIMAKIDQLSAKLKQGMPDMQEDADKNGIPDNQELPGDMATLLSEEGIQSLSNTIDDVVKWLWCGFWGGGCIAMPMNYAPLAPGAAPVFMGNPMGTLTPFTGLPVFAAPTTCGPVVVWPPCPSGAGWWLSPAGVSQFRLFWTPTLTGAQGMAICWGSNLSAYAMPPGVSPIVPGGNCIVVAAPLNSCKDDGSDGDVSGQGQWTSGSGGGTGAKSYLNAEACKKPTETITEEDRKMLIEYAKWGTFNRTQLAKRLSAFAGNMKGRSLIQLGSDKGWAVWAGIGIDADAIRQGNFGDIVKVNLKRIFPFPDFLMQWVTLQIEEFVNKLTSLPTLYIILPDFSALGGNLKNVSCAYKRLRKEDATGCSDAPLPPATSNTPQTAETLWNGDGKRTRPSARLNAYVRDNYTKSVSGMQEAFTLIGSLPLLEIDNEELTVTVPWIDQNSIDKMKNNYTKTANQWRKELERAKKEWSKLGSTSGAASAVSLDVENSIRSIEKNLKVLDGYGKFPEKLYKLLSWKETFIGQVLCNLSTIEDVTVGWMSRNGKRFKAWVELYVLIKAILKTWQLMIDVFTGYEAECSACKNERWNLQHFIWKLISMVIPQVPVIQFPKWPDIILDLHNIRWGLRVKVPTFTFEVKPIVLPYLPKLSLPNTPGLGIGLPQIPVLPGLPSLPGLPELPSLPKLELPDLPPPPTIPKLFGFIEVFLNILKLIKKILCLMRINPFIPEWYAGAQIAIITERQGKLPIDFLDVSMPQFSYPWVDAIKVTTYVNLEFDADFIVEFTRAILSPLSQFTTDFTSLSNIIKTPKTIAVPGVDNINADVTTGGIQRQGYTPIEKAAVKFVLGFAKELKSLTAYLETAKNDTIDTVHMKQLFAQNIDSLERSGWKDEKKIAGVLRDALQYDGSAEDQVIAGLTRMQEKKWKSIHAILGEENIENKTLKTELSEVLKGKKSFENLSIFDAHRIGNIKVAATTWGAKKELLRDLDTQNTTTLKQILSPAAKDPLVTDIKTTGDRIISEVNTGVRDFSKLMAYNATRPLALNQTSGDTIGLDPLPDATSGPVTTSTTSTSSLGTSAPVVTSTSADTYEYKGLYLLYTDVAGKSRQTHLFDYTDETEWTEEVIPLDAHRDGDEDVVFRIGNSLYIKYAGPNTPKTTTNDTEEYDWTTFLDLSDTTPTVRSAPNYLEESFDSPNEINLSFRGANEQKDKKFRMEYFDYIDRFDRRESGESDSTAPAGMRRETIDMIADLSRETQVSDAFTGITLHDTIATFWRGSGAGSLTMPVFDRWTNKNGSIDITEGRTIYTDSEWAIIEYSIGDVGANWKQVVVKPGQNVAWQMDGSMRVVSGSILLFRDATETHPVNLGELRGVPIISGTKLELSDRDSFVDIRYYQDENTYTLERGGSYEYRDLGDASLEYQVSLSRENDFYYAKLYPFSEGKIGTITNLALFAPQIQSDTQPPLLSLGKSFKIPVYQTVPMNMLKYIDDVSGIDRIWVEGDSLIQAGKTAFDLVFGEYTTLFQKAVQFFAQDLAGNVAMQPMTLQVYAPVPQITNVISRVVQGIINEPLKNEPIDIFRHRNGHIERVSWSGVLTDELGKFSYPIQSTASGVVLKNSTGSILLTIDETTGKIHLEDAKYAFSLRPASKTQRTMIAIVDEKQNNLFTQSLSFPNNFVIEKANSLDVITNDGIYVKVEQPGFDVVKNSAQVPGLPYGAYITDTEKKPIIGISRDGNVYIMQSGYTMKYRETGTYISYLILDGSGQLTAEILFHMKAEYMVK